MHPTRRRPLPLLATFFALLFVASACGSSGGGNSSGDCTDGATQCTGNTFQTCTDGAFENTNLCTSRCEADLGCVDCEPETEFCDTDNNVVACNANGQQGGVVEACDETVCVNGACVDLCAQAVEAQSYLGCEYFAADLDNGVQVVAEPTIFGCIPPPLGPEGQVVKALSICKDVDDNLAGICDVGATPCPTGFTCEAEVDVCVLDAAGSPFAIVVANPQLIEIDITLETKDGIAQTITVPPGEVSAIYPQELGFDDASVDRTSQAPLAYKLSAFAPFVAYQFNPLNNENVFSNDGALLIPRHAFDSTYYALTMPTLEVRPASHDLNGFVTVVAWEDGTEVLVTPSADVREGASIPAIVAGTPTTFTLNAFDVLNLEASAPGDLSGTKVETTDATKSIAVFAGHEAMFIANDAETNCCADHIEEMMFPASTWGTEYAVAQAKPREDETTDLVRVIALSDATTVSVSGAAANCPMLNAGEFCDIDLAGDIEVAGSGPIMVGHYLKSINKPLGLGQTPNPESGDPSFSIAVPIEQYRSEYDFLVPEGYAGQYISVIVPSSESVMLNGNDISGQLTDFASGGYKAGRIPLDAGQHRLTCSDGCGLEVYGYSAAVSYMFAGGLDLERIVIDSL